MSLQEGVVVWFDKHKGYGFIKKPDGNDMLLHTKLMPKNGGISRGDRVQFKASDEHKGLATGVRVIGYKNKTSCG
jgi:cold shock CspA family protein